MIVVRTPLRLSFVGGGSDLKAFYEKKDGMVIRRLRRFSQIKKKEKMRDQRTYKIIDPQITQIDADFI